MVKIEVEVVDVVQEKLFEIFKKQSNFQRVILKNICYHKEGFINEENIRDASSNLEY